MPQTETIIDDRELAALFPVPVAARIATSEMYGAPLHPLEEAAVAAAVPKRRAEFAAGRACAHAALAALAAPRVPILKGKDRAPVWPPSFAGTIAHCDGFCAAAVCRMCDARSIGMDAETAVPLDAQLSGLVCTRDEIAELRALPPLAGGDWPKLAFSAKEAFYKCYFPLARTFLDFRDVSVRFSRNADDRAGAFSVTIENPVKPLRDLQSDFLGRWMVRGAHVFCTVTLPPES